MSKDLHLYQLCNALDRGLEDTLAPACDLFVFELGQGAYEAKRAFHEKEKDQVELDQLNSVIQENKAKVQIYVNLYELNELICRNPFPGEQMPLLAIARALLPDATVLGRKGMRAWASAFSEIHLDYRTRIYFPAEGGAEGGIYTNEGIESIEEQLHASMNMHGYIPASILESILETTHRTQLYRNTKESLTERGWAWASKRIDGKATKTMVPPNPSESRRDSPSGSRYG
jgi:hypothetical protein